MNTIKLSGGVSRPADEPAAWCELRRAVEAVAARGPLVRLQQLMNGRRPRPLRSKLAAKWKAAKGRIEGVRLPRATWMRDPRDVAFRWLRRFVGGVWHRGGSHVARLHYGPGIAFPGFDNSKARPIRAELLNFRLALPAPRGEAA